MQVSGPKPPPKPEKKRLILRFDKEGSSEFSQKSKETLDSLLAKTRTPFGQARALSDRELNEFEKGLLDLQRDLENREKLLREREIRLTDKERELEESKALINAQLQVLKARQDAADATPQEIAPLSAEEQKALERLRDELDARENSIEERMAMIHEREAFLDQSEETLMEKSMALSERETELDQREDDLNQRGANLQRQ